MRSAGLARVIVVQVKSFTETIIRFTTVTIQVRKTMACLARRVAGFTGFISTAVKFTRSTN